MKHSTKPDANGSRQAPTPSRRGTSRQTKEFCSPVQRADFPYRATFESLSLIFVQDEANQCRWVKPSQCLWSSATEIQNRTSLSTYYDDKLEHFFVDILGVPRLD